MEISTHIVNSDLFEKGMLQELKPLKGPEFDLDVQRFNSVLFGDSPFITKSVNSTEITTEKNVFDDLGNAILEGVGDIRQSVNHRINDINHKIHTQDELTTADLLNLQWQVTLFSLESSLISKSGDKVGEGIRTLFRNQ